MYWNQIISALGFGHLYLTTEWQLAKFCSDKFKDQGRLEAHENPEQHEIHGLLWQTLDVTKSHYAKAASCGVVAPWVSANSYVYSNIFGNTNDSTGLSFHVTINQIHRTTLHTLRWPVNPFRLVLTPAHCRTSDWCPQSQCRQTEQLKLENWLSAGETT